MKKKKHNNNKIITTIEWQKQRIKNTFVAIKSHDVGR